MKNHQNLGLTIIRVGIGAMFMFHGFGKITGGPEFWAKLGSATQYVGINFAPQFFGFMAAFAEFFGGFFLILGLFFRPACILLLCTMIVAASKHLGTGDGLKGASHAIEAAIVFLGLYFMGAGDNSIDQKLKNRK